MYLAFKPEGTFIEEAAVDPSVAAAQAFELDILRPSGRNLLTDSADNKVHITGRDDDDKDIGLRDPKENPDGWRTCKSLDQVRHQEGCCALRNFFYRITVRFGLSTCCSLLFFCTFLDVV